MNIDGVNRAVERIMKGEKIKPARISLTLEQHANTRLEYLIKKLDTSKQSFIENAVDGVLYDVEMQLGLRDANTIIVNVRGEKVHPPKDEYMQELVKIIEAKSNTEDTE